MVQQVHQMIKGYEIYYEGEYEPLRYGFEYLYNLSDSEFKTLVDAAQKDGTGNFHDVYNAHYVLKYDYHWHSYSLEKM